MYNAGVKSEIDALTDDMFRRKSPFSIRTKKQQAKMNLPHFPTHTVGSFPQTKEIRVARQHYKKGVLTEDDYNAFLRNECKRCISIQEEIGVDVLSHGEFERNDMVEYFGEQLGGYAFTENGWVQSYGSRCVKPAILYGDVTRPEPMTVKWISESSMTPSYSFYLQVQTVYCDSEQPMLSR
jgi:5-methyltetrahydropteroyltriglutamate--homocysteine methyltransferase